MAMSSTSSLKTRGNDTKNPDKTLQQSDESTLTDATNSLSLSPRSAISENKRRVSKLTKYHKELLGLQRSPLYKPQRTQNRRNVPAFLNKLFNMVDDQSTSNFIRWSPSGTSFLVENHEEFAKTVLPRFYKHNTFSSFVRQLNMYDFHKVPVIQHNATSTDPKKEIWEFKQPNFQRDRQDLLSLVVRKRNKDKEQPTNEQISLPTLIEDVSSIKEKHVEIIESLQTLHTDNELIWKEALELREKYKRQQHITSKIVQFLSLTFRDQHMYLQKILFDLQDSSEVQEKEEESKILKNKTELPIENIDVKKLDSFYMTVTENLGQRQAVDPTFKEQKNIFYSSMLDSASKAAHNITQNMDQLWTNVESLASQLWMDLPESNNNMTTDKDSSGFSKLSSKQAKTRQQEISDSDNQPVFNQFTLSIQPPHNGFHATAMPNMTVNQQRVDSDNTYYMNVQQESSTHMPNILMESSTVINDDTIATKKDESKYKKNMQNKRFFNNHRPNPVLYK